MISKQDLWNKVKPTWNKAHNFILSLGSKVLEGKVSKEIKNERILSCHGINEEGKQIQPPCRARGFNTDKKFHSCNLCGCGAKEIARISSYGSTENNPIFDEEYMKLDFPYLACPMQKKGFSNYDGDENIQGDF